MNRTVRARKKKLMAEDDAWFLTDTDNDKMYNAIWNYLSLGQIEFARALIHIHPQPPRLAATLRKFIEYGPPEKWVCSESIPSTAHLLCCCLDELVVMEQRDSLEPWYGPIQKRCEFDLILAMALLEINATVNLPSKSASDLRRRYSQSILGDSGSREMILPRIMIVNKTSLRILPSESVSVSPPIRSTVSVDTILWLFQLCQNAPNCGIGLIKLLHSVSPGVSAQLTHLQAALVADSIRDSAVSSVSSTTWYHLRFLNELGRGDILETSPPIMELMGMLVTLVNSKQAGNWNRSPVIDKLIKEFLSDRFNSH
jgi:hypothetical protein